MLLSDPETGKNAKFPYVVNLPGFIGNVRSHFFTNMNKWRDVGIFNAQLGTIKQVKVDFPGKKDGSFTINVDKDRYNVINDKNETLTNINSATVSNYLNLYSHTYMESFINFIDIADSVMQDAPIFTITAEDLDGDITILDAFPIVQRDYREEDPKATYVDDDRMHARLTKNGRTDFVLIQYFTFDNLTVTAAKFLSDPIVDK